MNPAIDPGRPGTPDGVPSSSVETTRFAHASEAEMARILDFYDVRWEYEPTTFPILWNLEGDVVESFAPDFYLPELEVYLEMTTLKQRLVRKKNRKLRRLRELYPDIRIKLFYARDFRAMMLKYGRLGLAASLSGTTGQVVPARPAFDLTEPESAEPETAEPRATEPHVTDPRASGPQGIEPSPPDSMPIEAPAHSVQSDPPAAASASRSAKRSRAARRRRLAAVHATAEREAGA
jgi:hypoxanthine phosphoribosyltransferase